MGGREGWLRKTMGTRRLIKKRQGGQDQGEESGMESEIVDSHKSSGVKTKGEVGRAQWWEENKIKDHKISTSTMQRKVIRLDEHNDAWVSWKRKYKTFSTLCLDLRLRPTGKRFYTGKNEGILSRIIPTPFSNSKYKDKKDEIKHLEEREAKKKSLHVYKLVCR